MAEEGKEGGDEDVEMFTSGKERKMMDESKEETRNFSQ